ncbi:MAG: hypothetical protein HY074_16785 [Deltaproteobacteria bacterium]|nr:hypothetical protein [Deltaproteobacteria bacterium]
MAMQLVVAGRGVRNAGEIAASASPRSLVLAVESSSAVEIAARLRAAAQRLAERPSSILLIGAFEQLEPLSIPTGAAAADRPSGTILSDSLFGDLDGDGYPEIPVGRLMPGAAALASSLPAVPHALTLCFNHSDYQRTSALFSRGLSSTGFRVFHRPSRRFDRESALLPFADMPLSLVAYFGHSDARGWLGYRGGITPAHLERVRQPARLVFSPTCETLAPGTDSFGRACVLEGRAQNFLGATAATFTEENGIFARTFGAALGAGAADATIGMAMQHAFEKLRHGGPRAADNLAAYALWGNPECRIR